MDNNNENIKNKETKNSENHRKSETFDEEVYMINIK